MKKSAFISDIIFAGFACFLFTLCLFRYVGIHLVVALSLSVICGVLMGGAVWAFLQSRRHTLYLKKSEESEKEKLLLHLALLSDEGKTQFFLERLSSPEAPAKKFQKLRIFTEESFYGLHFSLAPLTADDVLRFSRVRTKKQKIFLCAQADERALALAEELRVRILRGEQVYAILKEQNALPELYLNTAHTPTKKRRMRLWLSRANAKRFLVASILILGTALLSPFPYYYLWFGGGLLLSSLLVRIFGYE